VYTAGGRSRDSVAFLAQHDRATGASAKLFPAAAVGLGAERSPELDHLTALVIFGTDGGLEVFAFDKSGAVVVVPWIGSVTDAIPQGTFSTFLSRLVEDKLFDALDRSSGISSPPSCQLAQEEPFVDS